MDKITIVVGITMLVIGGVASFYFFNKTVPDTQITWNKPTTNAGWAEDVKRENFDIKSTKVLQEMLVSHQRKLKEEVVVLEKYIDCPECMKYEARKYLTDTYAMSGGELEAEVEKSFNDGYAGQREMVEKLKQSIERMEKEIELRQKGYVIIDDGKTDLSGYSADRIRKIND